MVVQSASLAAAGSRPVEILKSVADAVRTGGEKAMSGQREVTELLLTQAKENADALFGTLQTVAAAVTPIDAGRVYMNFMTNASKKYLEQVKTLGAMMSRASKDAWQPVVEATSATGRLAVASMKPEPV